MFFVQYVNYSEGKTVQTVSFLASLREEQIYGPFLLVVPLSTLRHWEREFAFWTPDVNCVCLSFSFFGECRCKHRRQIVYTGSQEARKIIKQYEFYYDNTKNNNKKKKEDKTAVKFTVLLTSYELVLQDSLNSLLLNAMASH